MLDREYDEVYKRTFDIEQEDYDWLVGLFLADGYRDRSGDYRMGFCLSPFKDHDVLDKLVKILTKMGFKPRVKLKQTISTIIVTIYSKYLYHILPEKSEFYTPKSIDALIAGFLDGDGFITPTKDCIGVTQKIVKWMCPLIYCYFESRGIHSWYKTGVHIRYGGMQYYRTSLKQVRTKTQVLDFMAKGALFK